MTYQQGDVLITKVTELPNKTTTKRHPRGSVLAEGEATGHAHVAESGTTVLESEDKTLYLRAPQGTTIHHEEHDKIILPPGDYQIGIVQEFDHFSQKAERVRD